MDLREARFRGRREAAHAGCVEDAAVPDDQRVDARIVRRFDGHQAAARLPHHRHRAGVDLAGERAAGPCVFLDAPVDRLNQVRSGSAAANGRARRTGRARRSRRRSRGRGLRLLLAKVLRSDDDDEEAVRRDLREVALVHEAVQAARAVSPDDDRQFVFGRKRGEVRRAIHGMRRQPFGDLDGDLRVGPERNRWARRLHGP